MTDTFTFTKNIFALNIAPQEGLENKQKKYEKHTQKSQQNEIIPFVFFRISCALSGLLFIE